MKKLPAFLEHYFWDIDFSKIDMNKTHPVYIIKRILNFGNDRATKWLFRNFEEEAMKQALMNHRGFSKRATTYWGKFFKMPKHDIMYFKKGFPNPPVRLWSY